MATMVVLPNTAQTRRDSLERQAFTLRGNAVTKMTSPELKKRFTYHSPKDDQPKRYEEIRYRAHSLAEYIVINTPDSRERSLALTKLEEAVMWANAAIARNE